MARSRDISKVLSSNSTLATDAEVAATYQTQAGTGLIKIVPSSVAVGSGTGSASALGTVTFTGVSSLNLNGVFSSTYNAYQIVLTISTFATGGQINYRYGTNGTPQTGASYSVAGIYGDNNNTSGAFGQSGQTSILWGQSSASGTEAWFGVVEVGLPNSAVRTFSSHRATTNGATRSTFQGGAYNGTDQFTDFIILPNANMTGTVSVYGYK